MIGILPSNRIRLLSTAINADRKEAECVKNYKSKYFMGGADVKFQKRSQPAYRSFCKLCIGSDFSSIR